MRSKSSPIKRLSLLVLEKLSEEIGRKVSGATVEHCEFDPKRGLLRLFLVRGTQSFSLMLSAVRDYPGAFLSEMSSRPRRFPQAPSSALNWLLETRLDHALASQQQFTLSFLSDERTRYSILLDLVERPRLFLYRCRINHGPEQLWTFPVSEQEQALDPCPTVFDGPSVEPVAVTSFLVCYENRDAGPSIPVQVHADDISCPEHTNPRAFSEANEAVRRFVIDGLYRLRYEELKRTLEKAIQKRLKKIRKRIQNIQDDLREATQATRVREYGDLLLAHAHDGQRGRSKIILPSFDGTSHVAVPLDPTKTPIENAQLYYRKAKKLEEKGRVAERRLREAYAEQEEFQAMAQQIEQAPTVKALEKIAREMEAALGIQVEAKAGANGAHRSSGRKEPRLLKFTSADGLEILAGKSADDNETLTFRLAREHDFWFHAAGTAGAHVVVRNPQRLEKCPPRTAQQAASLAAYLSRHRNSSNVLVHFTQRRHLKKAKGGPKGAVIMRTFQSMFAKPGLPDRPSPHNGE